MRERRPIIIQSARSYDGDGDGEDGDGYDDDDDGELTGAGERLNV